MLLSLEKGTNCGLTSQELWLWQVNMAKRKGGTVQSLYPPKEGAVIVLDVDILDKL